MGRFLRTVSCAPQYGNIAYLASALAQLVVTGSYTRCFAILLTEMLGESAARKACQVKAMPPSVGELKPVCWGLWVASISLTDPMNLYQGSPNRTRLLMI